MKSWNQLKKHYRHELKNAKKRQSIMYEFLKSLAKFADFVGEKMNHNKTHILNLEKELKFLSSHETKSKSKKTRKRKV